MKVDFDMPDVDVSPIRLGRVLRKIYRAEGPTSYQDQAILENFTRLVQNAATEYHLGKEAILKFWDDNSAFNFSATVRSAAHFENCITSVHRAVCYLEVIRKRQNALPNSRQHLPKRLSIGRSGNQDRIRCFRNAIHHTEGDVMKGVIAEGQWFCPVATGNEVPNGRGTRMTISRIELGSKQIRFGELATWIGELRQCAEVLIDAEYSGQPRNA